MCLENKINISKACMMQRHSKHLNIDTEQKTSPAESITGRSVLSAVHTLQRGKTPHEGILFINV